MCNHKRRARGRGEALAIDIKDRAAIIIKAEQEAFDPRAIRERHFHALSRSVQILAGFRERGFVEPFVLKRRGELLDCP